MSRQLFADEAQRNRPADVLAADGEAAFRAFALERAEEIPRLERR